MIWWPVARAGQRRAWEQPRRQWPRRQWLVTLLALVLAGCTSFPTSGPVEQVSVAAVPDGRARGIDVAAQAPVSGASPEAILEGFFSASESPGDGYLVARQFLTPEAAGDWRPESGIRVFDATGQTRVVTADGSAVLRAPLVGRLDPEQVFTAVYEPDFTHNFQMTQVDGEWRIGNPGPGILMSIQRFHRAFQSVPVYYLDAGGERLVSAQVFLRQSDVNPQSPDALVRALISGPGSWLRPAVLDALPTEVQSLGTRVDADGVAHVNLSEEIEALTAEQRIQAAAQLLFTLDHFDTITGLSIEANGRQLSIRGTDADGVVRMTTVARFAPDRPVVSRDLFGVRDGAVIRIGEAPGGVVSTLPGPLGGGWEETPGQLAVSWAGDRLGVLSEDAERLFTAGTLNTQPELRYSGTRLVKPQFDASGMLWTIDNTDGGPVAVRVGQQGDAALVQLPELDDARVIAFRISPDMTRMAVIAEFGTVQQLGFLRLRGNDQLIVDGWRPLPVNTSRGLVTHLRDVAFVSPNRILVLGAGERDPAFTVHSLDVDAAQVTSQGPLSDVDPVSLTAMPVGTVNAVAVVTAANLGLRYEAQYRWTSLITDVTDLAYPS